MKTCPGCGILKEESQYRLFKKYDKYVRRSRCLECESSYYRSREYREKANEKNSRYRAEGRVRHRDSAHFRLRQERYPEKSRASQLVNQAIKKGELIRPLSCDQCGVIPQSMRGGRSGIQAHHEDYSRPLDVMWLCHSCHISVHRARSRRDGGGVE